MIEIIYKMGLFINLDEELLDLSLDVQNLRLQIRGFVGGDGSRDDGARDTTGTTQGSLGGNKDVRDVLVFTQKRKMEENFQRLGISYSKTHTCQHAMSHIKPAVPHSLYLPAMTMNSEIPLLRVLVASLAPFLSCL